MPKKKNQAAPESVSEPTDGRWVAPTDKWQRIGKVTLRVAHGREQERVVALDDRQRIVVGRAESADVILSHPSVSLTHFELHITPEGVTLRDLDSTNGTWIGQLRVRDVDVCPGTKIVAGDFTLVVDSIEAIEVPVWEDDQLGEMLGRSTAMRETFARLVKVAETPLDVLLTGETGTGKELAARAIHGASDRANDAWVVFDCAAQATSLFEAVLFGYRKGAFTGADSDRAGLFESADGGTIFIDEVGELPLNLQARLLRVLDRKEITRIGETMPRAVDVRVIAATHRDLVRMVAAGDFREDLFHRLNRSRIELPPLRHRQGDAEMLAERILETIAKDKGTELRLSGGMRAHLASNQWPGNVRELRNTVEYAAYLAEGDEVTPVPPTSAAATKDRNTCGCYSGLNYHDGLEAYERDIFRRALEQTGGKLLPAAQLLGIGRERFKRRLRELGMYGVGHG